VHRIVPADSGRCQATVANVEKRYCEITISALFAELLQ